jgi:hypothetical protein
MASGNVQSESAAITRAAVSPRLSARQVAPKRVLAWANFPLDVARFDFIGTESAATET